MQKCCVKFLQERGKSIMQETRRVRMISQGLKGKYIAVVGHNCFQWALSYLAAASVGIVVPLDKELSVEDIDNFLQYANILYSPIRIKIHNILTFLNTSANII